MRLRLRGGKAPCFSAVFSSSRRRVIGLQVVAVALAFSAGCATTETVKQARGEGSKRLFPQDLKGVRAAVVAAAKSRGLDVLETNDDGFVLSAGVNWRSFGERVAVFVRAVSPRLTEVEVVSRPLLVSMNFPRDWEHSMLDAVDRSLRGEKSQ